MKKGLSEIVVIIDRSGSMCSIREDTIGGFNTFLKDQQAQPGEATFSLIQFDDHYEIHHDRINIKDAPLLTENTFVPRGSTALLDAMGKTIVTIGEKLKNTPEDERPEHVIFAIFTDGQENSSNEFKTRKQIFDMVKHQQDVYSWKFMYLGANQDAIAEGDSYGFTKGMAVNFVASGVGTKRAMRSLSSASSLYRSGNDSITLADIDNESTSV